MQKTDALQQVRFLASLQLRTFIILTAITYIYFHANIYYHISMKGDSI